MLIPVAHYAVTPAIEAMKGAVGAKS